MTANFPLTMGPNNRYFVDQNGVPFLVNGDSPQSLLVDLSASDTNLYLTTRKSQGFNTIIVDVLADTSTGGNANGTTYDGIAPFTSGSSPSSYDLSTPNPTYFARLDAVVSMAAANGFLVFLDPIETIGWLQTLQNNGTSKAFDFGVFLGNRYKDYPNVAWQSGNDFQSWANTSDSDLVYQVMAGIKSVAPSQIQTIQLSFPTSYSNQDTVTLPAINMDAAYTYHDTYDMMLQAFNSSPTSPVFLVEGNYEGENNGFSFPGVTGTFILRAQEYWTMTSGGVGQFYGSHWDWGFASGWQSTLDSAGVAQLPYWTDLFTSVEWWKLVPDQNHQIVTAGYGTYNAYNDNFYSSNYATTAWNPDGTTSVTYDIAGSALTVDLAKFVGPVSAQWYDPSNGTYQSVTGSPFANTSPWVFQPPGQNHEGDSDWVLVLHADATLSNNDAAEVARLYYGLLDRAPDPGGLQAFTNALESGASPQLVAQSILSSPEYENTSIGQSNASFVQYLYSTALGRTADAPGFQSWETALNTGTLSRADVVNGFLDSFEFQSDFAGQSNATYINEVYEVALQRPAEPQGLAGWETALLNGMSRTTFDHLVVGSAEFQSSITEPAAAAFVGMLYEQALGRAPDAAGLQGWTSALVTSNLNNAEVAIGIAESPEAQQFLAPRIENDWHLLA
jgi:hypothetical protein